MKTLIVILLLFVFRSQACPDPSLCQNQDCGSCGNACCKLEVNLLGYSTEETVVALNSSLADGGFDGSYTPSHTAEGTLGFADLRVYNKSIDFIGQAIHMTPAPYYYNDSISMTIAPNDEGSILLAFSTSLIAGAYCDAGQNYYNIVALINGAFADSSNISWTNADDSCQLDV